MPVLLLLLLLTGCAAPGRELQRGTPVMSPPPPVRPGHGAPVVGQPGQQPQEVPRSPHHRALPPTREPGLWAGDAPRASRAAAPSRPEILGVTVPFMSDEPTEEEERPTRACASMLSTVLSKVSARERIESLTPAQRRCLAALLYEECSLDLLDAVEGAQAGSWAHSPHERRIHAAVVEAAKRFEREACEGVVPSIAAKSVREAVRQQWSHEPWGEP